MPPDDAAAEVFLDARIDQLMKLINEANVPFNEETIHRQIVDFIRALRLVRKMARKINIKLGVNPIPSIVTYINT